MEKTKTQKRVQRSYKYSGLGFPLIIQNVPMTKIYGNWVPDINFTKLENIMAIALAFKSRELVGNEVKFIRLHFRQTLGRFAKNFHLTRQAVTKWEKHGNSPTNMEWSKEKDLRLFILNKKKISGTLFQKAYEKLSIKEFYRKRQNVIPANWISRSNADLVRELAA